MNNQKRKADTTNDKSTKTIKEKENESKIKFPTTKNLKDLNKYSSSKFQAMIKNQELADDKSLRGIKFKKSGSSCYFEEKYEKS